MPDGGITLPTRIRRIAHGKEPYAGPTAERQDLPLLAPFAESARESSPERACESAGIPYLGLENASTSRGAHMFLQSHVRPNE